MRRIIAALGIFLCLYGQAVATQRTPSVLKSTINSQIVANKTGAITESILNAILVDMVDSYADIACTQFPALSGAVASNGASCSTNPSTGLLNALNTWNAIQTFGTLPIFSTCTGYLYGNAGSQATCSTSVTVAVGSITGLGSGVATWLATPSSANLASAVTDETGSGPLVFATSPALTTPNLGTPSAATLTNATGLPVSTGISGFGTGVATALGINVGSAGAFVVNGGALGTPASGTLTNATGLPISGITGLGTNVDTALGTALATAANVQAGTSSAALVTPAALSGSAAVQTLTDGATVNWDMASGYNAKVTLGGNRTLAAPTNVQAGITYTIQVIQDGTGSRTVTWNAAYKWGTAGTPVLTTTASATDIVTCFAKDTTPTLLCAINKGY